MTTDTIIAHVQNHAAAYAVGGVLFLVLTLSFRKFMLPLLYHTFEYIAYCTIAHIFLGGFVRAFSWFREETEFKNFKGEVVDTWKPYTTPLDLNFWQRSMYSPHWLFWFELVIAAGLLWVVVFIRPTRLRGKSYVSKKPAPGAISSGSKVDPKAYKAGSKLKTARSR